MPHRKHTVLVIYTMRLQNMKVISAWCQEKNVTKNKPVRSGCILAYLLYRADGKKTRLISGSMQFMKRMNVCRLKNISQHFDDWITAIWWMNGCSLTNEWLQFAEWITAVWWMNVCSLYECSFMNEWLQYVGWMTTISRFLEVSLIPSNHYQSVYYHDDHSCYNKNFFAFSDKLFLSSL